MSKHRDEPIPRAYEALEAHDARHSAAPPPLSPTPAANAASSPPVGALSSEGTGSTESEPSRQAQDESVIANAVLHANVNASGEAATSAGRSASPIAAPPAARLGGFSAARPTAPPRPTGLGLGLPGAPPRPGSAPPLPPRERAQVELLSAEIQTLRRALSAKEAEVLGLIDQRDAQIAAAEQLRKRAEVAISGLAEPRPSKSSAPPQPSLEADRGRLALDEISAECDKLRCERDELVAERDKLLHEREASAAEWDKLRCERDELVAERDKLLHEREASAAEWDKLRCERDEASADRDRTNEAPSMTAPATPPSATAVAKDLRHIAESALRSSARSSATASMR